MQPIVAPLKPNDTGPAVVNLINGLLLLSANNKFIVHEPPSAPSQLQLDQTVTQLTLERNKSYYGDATRQLVLWFQLQSDLGDGLLGIVEDKSAALINQMIKTLGGFSIVKGTVKYSNNQVASGLVVRAVDKDLRIEQPLGDVFTDSLGNYEIAYGPEQAGNAEEGTADIIVRVFADNVSTTPVAESAVNFNAPTTLVVDLTVPKVVPVVSELERYLTIIMPLLVGQADGGGNLAVADLTSSDLQFIAGDSGIDLQHLGLLVSAHQLERKYFVAPPRPLPIFQPTVRFVNIGGVVAPQAISRVSVGGGFINPLPTVTNIPASFFYGALREGIPSDPTEFIQQTISTLRYAVKQALDKNIIPASLSNDLENLLAHVPNSSRDELHQLIGNIGLPDTLKTALMPHVDAVAGLNDQTLKSLVESNVLSEVDARKLGVVTTLRKIGNWEVGVVQKLAVRNFASVSAGRIGSAQDLALLDVGDWRSSIDDLGLPIPAGSTADAYARLLAIKAQTAFPNTALISRMLTTPADTGPNIEKILPLLKLNPGALQKPFEDLKTNELNQDSLGNVASAHGALQRLANLNPGLGLSEVITAEASPAVILVEVNNRIGWIKTFAELNPDINFITSNLLPGSDDLANLKFGDLSGEARKAVLANLKAYQRTYSVSGNPIVTRELMAAGFHGALQIANTSIDEMISKTGLSELETISYRATAKEKSNVVAHLLLGFQEIQHNDKSTPIPSLPTEYGFFPQLEGYVEMFGKQTTCKCSHCQSMLSPAAYFVDLMYYIEQNILDGSFGNRQPQHPLHLQQRRPDLWALELSCANTENYVAYLDIVNEVLENYIVSQKSLPNLDTLYEKLSDAETFPTTGYFSNPSFSQPLSFAAHRLETLLGHFSLSLYDIACAIGSNADARVRTRLGLSPKAYDLIITNREGNVDFLSVLFNYSGNLSHTDPNWPIDPLSISSLMEVTGLDRETMEATLKTDFVDTITPLDTAIEIVIGIGTPGGIQNDSEYVRKLTPRRLDRLHRFVRLWRCLPWTVAELDYVLNRLSANTNGVINTDLQAIVEMLDLQARLDCQLDELMALWDDISNKILRADKALFDRLFNLAPFVKQQGAWPKTFTYTHPGSGTANGATPDTQRLLAALQISDADLVSLIQFLHPSAGATLELDIGGNEKNGDLATLYRCTKLASALSLSIPEFIKSISLVSEIAEIRSLNPASLGKIIRFVDWKQHSGFTSDEIAQVVNGTSGSVSDIEKLSSNLVLAVMQEHALEFASTLLTKAGFTESASRTLLENNVSTDSGDGKPLEKLPAGRGFRLLPDVPLEAERSLVFGKDLFEGIGLSKDLSGIIIQNNQGVPDVFVGKLADKYYLNPTFNWTDQTNLAFNADYLASILTDTNEQALFLAKNAGVGGIFSQITGVNKYVLVPNIDLTILSSKMDTTDLQGKPEEIDAKAAGIINLLGYLIKATQCVKQLSTIRQFNPVSVFTSRFSSVIGFAVEKISGLLKVPAERNSNEVIDKQLIARVLRGDASSSDLVPLIKDLSRLAILLKHNAITADDIDWIADHPTLFGLAQGSKPSVSCFQKVTDYATLIQVADRAFYPNAPSPEVAKIREVFEKGIDTPPNAPAAPAESIAACLRTDVPSINALLKPSNSTLTNVLGADVFSDLHTLQRILGILGLLGIDGQALDLMISENYQDVAKAAEAVYGAFRAKYPDDKAFQDKMEPYEDKLRGIKRDALVGYFTTNWNPPFTEPSKLYEYFLLDVQMEGCARTSRLVSAISGLQLYVHRVLMNLERSADNQVVAKFDARIPNAKEEWAWRQHYRVWEANRKVFLYPENYIEPSLRDDKTPLFKELEDTLLQKQITDQNALDAYSSYMSGFDEVSGLTICGSFRERPRTQFDVSTKDVLHLFATIPTDPPVYFYRAIETPESPSYSPWRKVDVQIPVRKVSPIVYLGRLFLFWTEIQTHPKNTVINGSSKFTGYTHKLQVKYTFLRLDGKWTPSQYLALIVKEAKQKYWIEDDPLIVDVESIKNRFPNAVNQWQKIIQDANEILKGNGDHFEVNFTADDCQQILAREQKWILMLNSNASAFDTYIGEARDDYHALLNELVSTRPSSILRLLFGLRETSLQDQDAMSNYTLVGDQWEKVFPFLHTDGQDYGLYLMFRNFRVTTKVNFITNTAEQVSLSNYLNYNDDYNYNGNGEQRLWYQESLQQVKIMDQRGVSFPICLDETPKFPLGTIFSEDLDIADASWGLPIGSGCGLESAVSNCRSTTPWTTLFSGSGLRLSVIDGSVSDAIVYAGSDQLLLTWSNNKNKYILRRLGTTLSHSFAKRLFESGFSGLLNKTFQYSNEILEFRFPVTPPTGSSLIEFEKSNSDAPYPIDFTGPFGVYFREIFFHIPFLVADHLNSQQQFAQAQRWYHYIFNPMAVPNSTDTEKTRSWQYREFFLNVNPETLRQILSNPGAIAAYKQDPFNPHAIARLRLSAYQKSVVMKYIDNLLDWGDDLFGQFTMESVNEAMMLYVMASDILGPKPMDLPSCGEGNISPKNYATIRPSIKKANEFLIELENVDVSLNIGGPQSSERAIYVAEINSGRSVLATQAVAMSATPVAADIGPFNTLEGFGFNGPSPSTTSIGMNWTTGSSTILWPGTGGTPLTSVQLNEGNQSLVSGATAVGYTGINLPLLTNIDYIQPFTGYFPPPGTVGVTIPDLTRFGNVIPGLGAGQFGDRFGPITVKIPPKDGGRFVPHDPSNLLPTKAVFCLPANNELLAYWDRVSDRLFKIRNCMDITGVRKQLDLFSPELDPHMLVRMKAAGISLEDLLESTRGELPPYRFLYLIDKAKQHVQTLQSFGNQLMSALEKRDGEELTHLRAVHEQNLLKIRRQALQWEIDAASDSAESLRRQKTAIENRRDYFNGLVNTGLLPWELTQQVSRHLASGIYTAEAILAMLAGGTKLIPNVGSPFAMTYGGREIGDSMDMFAQAMNSTAKISEAISASAGLEATFQRRGEEWRHQISTANDEINHIIKQISAAEIRLEIANKSLEVHDKSIEQTEEVFDFYRERFTNLGLYTFLSTEMHRLYRIAFNAAFGMAKMAEQAYRFERSDDGSLPLLENSYWDSGKAGLLAGERLLLDLHQLEKRFIETNYRQLEIEQSFSLAQIAPVQLDNLRNNKPCQFSLLEELFDVTYPGHFRRRIRGVRVTIPCVTGPYVNIPATLRLTGSRIRIAPRLDEDALMSMPLSHTVSIATSNANRDSGVFEFNFRDERFMPFELAGAVSDWTLELPAEFPVFDYQTISDVIVHLHYTADEDSQLRSDVNNKISTLLGRLSFKHTFSLRKDFPTEWRKFLNPSTADLQADLQEVQIEIGMQYFPFFMRNKTITLSSTQANPTNKVSVSLSEQLISLNKPGKIILKNSIAPFTLMTANMIDDIIISFDYTITVPLPKP